MSQIPINIAVEDELSERIMYRLLDESGRFAVGATYRRGGFGYLRKTIHGWNQAAKWTPFLVLTDLDNYACPSALMIDWLSAPKHPNLLFRVAVREVESWLLADSANLAGYFGVSIDRIPKNSDTLPDAKAALVDLARRSRFKVIRESIAPARGSTAKQGPAYNSYLGEFVRERWSFTTAKANSPSLARTIMRLESFMPVMN